MSQVYFVTGGAGFVGSNLVRKLVTKKSHIHLLLQETTPIWRIADLLDNELVTVHVGSLLNKNNLKKILQKIQPDVIYHLAARGAYPQQNDPQEIFTTNILGTLNLLEAADQVSYQLLVNTGSSSEYGFKTKPMSEQDLLEPASYYAVAKSTATLLCQYEAVAKKKPIVTVRLFSVYGPYEESTRLIPTVVKSLYTGQALQLTSPETARDFIYINDVIDFYLDVQKLKKQGGHYFNLGVGHQSTLREVIEVAQQVSGRQVECQWGKMEARTWDTTSWEANMSFTHRTFEWQPKYSLEKGVQAMWRWFLDHQQLYI